MSLVTNNSIGWACLQISGGWSRIAWVCGAIAVVVPLLMFGTMQLGEGSSASTLSGWYLTLGIVQGALFGIGMPSRVHAAIKRDRVGKLIESHRLMPTPARHAIFGYLVGANLFLLSCMATVFVIGLFISVPAGQDWRGWIALHAAAAGLSAMFCCVVAFTAQWLPKFNPALLGLMFGPTFGMASASFLPPLRVLFTPYFGKGFFDLQRGDVTGMHLVAVASQFLFSVIMFVGACRRYRRDDVPALGFGWGFALLSLWIALTLVGVLAVDSPPRRGVFNGEEPDRIAYVVALSVSMLLAIGPIASAAAARLRWRERRAIDPHFIERRPIRLPLAAAMVAIVVGTMLLAAPQEVGRLTSALDSSKALAIHYELTGVAIVLFITTIALLARAAARLRVGAVTLIAIWLVLMWIVPPMLDGMVTLFQGSYDTFPHAYSAASTPFALGMIWADRTMAAGIGLVAQAGAVVVLMVLWIVVKRTNSRRQAAPLLPDGVQSLAGPA